jgi:FkbM family methyltransferase
MMSNNPTAWGKLKDSLFEIRHGFRGAPITLGDLVIRVPVELRRLKTAESQLLDALRTHLKPGMTFVDVGANVGLMSVYAAACSAPDGRVYAFEPLPENLDLLRLVVRLNNCAARIPMVESAVSSDPDRPHLTFSAGPVDSGMQAESSLRASGEASREVTVANTTLDSHFAAGPKVDLIKVDTEGAERDVILGARNLIARDRPVLCIEYHGGKCADFGYSPDELRAEVSRLGYSETIISGDAATGYYQTLAVPR